MMQKQSIIRTYGVA